MADIIKSETEQIKYERDFLLMLILDEKEFGPGAFERAVEKLQVMKSAARRWTETVWDWKRS